jgi:hypothetical protein
MQKPLTGSVWLSVVCETEDFTVKSEKKTMMRKNDFFIISDSLVV